jgi:hypothetical protein
MLSEVCYGILNKMVKKKERGEDDTSSHSSLLSSPISPNRRYVE